MKSIKAADLDAQFAAAFPRAIDFPEDEYTAEKPDFDRIAASNGYRLAGIRLQRAVFTSKPTPPEVS